MLRCASNVNCKWKAKDETLKSFSANLWTLAIAALTILVDQASKWLVITRMTPGQEWAPVPALASIFTITYTTNTGAAFGLFKQGGVVFAGFAIIIVGVLLYYQRQLQDRQWIYRPVLGLLMGGALGNLIDRLQWGHVIDFIRVGPWPVFNVADSSIVVGVGLLMLLMWREDKTQAQSETPPIVPEPTHSDATNSDPVTP
jgi:signal peptidase II